MIKKLFINFLKRRHFWRFASFSEVGELYAGRVIRTVAMNIGAAFISVFMFKIGYSIVAISLFWAAYYGFKVLICIPLAQLIANIGTRKSIIISNFLYIPSMIAFVFLPQIGIWSLLITGIFQSASIALYDMAHTINFSRVKNVDSAGRQVALMNIVEKVAKGISPLIGGLIAMLFDPRVSIAASALFFILASWPMLRASDSGNKGFRLAPKGFPWKMTAQSLFMQLPIGFDIYASGNAWSIFLASLIFTTGGNQVYAELGALTSLILLVSLVSTHAYGKLIDKHAGGQLLLWTAIGNVIVHAFRAFTRTPAMAIGTNAANEVMTTGYSMAFMRGMFDVADRSGYRVFYVAMTQIVANIGSAVASLILAGLIMALDVNGGFAIFYLATAAVVSLIILSKFRLYARA